MIYEFPIITTTAYTKASPMKTDLRLTKGVIHWLDILFDDAVMGTLYLAITHGLHQLWPTNPEAYFRLMAKPISSKEGYKLYTAPYVLSVYSYLENADYEHEARIRISLLLEDDLRGVKILWDEETEGIRG